jgi:hypothetical protein
VTDSPDHLEDFTAPRRRFDLPAVIALAVVALAAGIIMSRNTSRSATERAEAPPRPDCVRFPGACIPGLAVDAPSELVPLAEAVRVANDQWAVALERGRKLGVFPEKALADLRTALGTTSAAVLDAKALLHAADSAGADERTRAEAVQALRMAYEHRFALLSRATRQVEGASTPVSGYGQPSIDEGTAVPTGAVVYVRLQSGSVRVTGWDRDSVHVTGRLAPGETWVTEPGTDTVVVRAEGMPRGLSAPSELDIQVPRGARVVVRAAAASLVVRGLNAEVDLSTAAGNLLVESVVGPIRAETMLGTLTVVGPVAKLTASTTSGALLVSAPYDTAMVGEAPVITRRASVTEPFGDVLLRSVSGRITLDAPAVTKASVHNIRGDTRLVAVPVAGGVIAATSHVGLTTVAWPASTGALLDAGSMKGGVRVPARGNAEAGRLAVRAVRGDVAFEETP